GISHCALGHYAAAIDELQPIFDGRDTEMAKRRFGATLPPYITATGWLTYAWSHVGKFPEAFTAAARGLEASVAPLAHAMLHFFRAQAFELCGEFRQARGDAERAVQLCETHGVLTWLAASYSALGLALSRSGSSSAGLGYLERAVSICESAGVNL